MKIHPLVRSAFLALSAAAPAREATVSIRYDDILVERPASLIGGNIEDLNFQLYGGLYSQLLHGECFEEHVDPSDLLKLTGPQRLTVWVVPDAHGQPVLRYFNGRKTRVYESDGTVDGPTLAARGNEPVKGSSLPFRGGIILPDELPDGLGKALVALATGDAQVSRHWRKVQSGSAAGTLKLVRQGVFTGTQAQQIQFVSGEGELGINNAGLFREGINLTAGKPYEGILRIKSNTAQQAFVSLRDANGKTLAEKPLDLAAKPDAYQRITFDLTPTAADPHGQFALTLKHPGAITVDYAFLQAGEWGRYQGLPVRRDLAEAMLAMGVQTMRYNGSMVNLCPDGARYYKWKQMIGPRDARPPYHGWFNPYASHGFSVFEFMDFCEAAGIRPLIGLRTDESAQDMADLIDYCLGGPDTEWGKRRIADGHPKPYLLKAIEIGNEEHPTPAYLARLKALASAIWSKNRELDVVASVNVGKGGATETFVGLAQWLKAQGQEARFILDSHYQSTLDHADTTLATAVGLQLHEDLTKAVPGFKLRLWPMEENGNACTWQRGLAHAHNLNTLNRMPACLERAGTANTFQAWNMNLVWDQGRIHFTPARIIYQPSWHVDRMFADEWLPVVLNARCSDPKLDALAKRSKNGSVLTIYLVNLEDSPVETRFDITGFSPAMTTVTRIASPDLKLRNTPDNPTRLTPATVDWRYDPARPAMPVPAYSFTTIHLERR